MYLIKNGYDSIVVLSLEAYSQLANVMESTLDEINRVVCENNKRMIHGKDFENLRRKINTEKKCRLSHLPIFTKILPKGSHIL